jgi:cysteine-rich repeat protein
LCNSTSTAGCVAQFPEACGDGINNQGGIEECDDGNALPGDGCNGVCKIEKNWSCPPAGKCTKKEVCGNGQIGAGEVCDDGNTLDNDGCDSTCTVQDPAFTCVAGVPCVRSSECGNKRIEAGENCDDGNTSGDGCSDSCKLEGGWVCPNPGNRARPPHAAVIRWFSPPSVKCATTATSKMATVARPTARPRARAAFALRESCAPARP